MKNRLFLEWFASSPKAFGVNLEADENDKTGPLFRGSKCQYWLHQICRSFTEKYESVSKNRNLTLEGRHDAIRRHAAQLLSQVKEKYREFLDPCVRGFTHFDSTHLRAVRPPADALEAVQRLAVQQHIAGLGDKERVELLNSAMTENDEATLAVFFHKPTIFKWLDPKFIAQTRRQYLAKHAPDVVQAETAGAVLTFDIERITNELSFFCPDLNNDAVEIHKHLAEVKKIGMSFETNGDLQMMKSGSVPTLLPELGSEPEPRV